MKAPFPAAGAAAALALCLVLVAACAHTDPSETRPAAQLAPDRSTVTPEEIRRTSDRPIEEILEGRIAGVDVHRAADGGIVVRIRGATSITASTEPLYVINGMPINPGPGGALLGISPYEIETIRVLKNPVDTAMYGMRGANGVIVIKTRRP